MTQQTKKIFYLCAMMVFIAMGATIFSDVYVPSLPNFVERFKTSHAEVQLSISLYLLAFCISGLFYGPLSDIYGRRKILLASAGIAILGTGLCLYQQTIDGLLIGRFIQGLGTGGFAVIGRAMVRDLFSGKQLTIVISYLSLGISIAPALAPAIGGYLEQAFGTYGAFYFMLSYVLLIIIMGCFFLPETAPISHHENNNTRKIDLKKMLSNYKTLLLDPHFLAYTLITAMSFSTIIVYFTIAPFYMQQTLHISPVLFGWIGLLIMSASVLGRFVTPQLLKRFKRKRIIYSACIAMLLLSCSLFILSQFYVQSIVIFVGLIWMIFFAASITFPLCMASAITPYGHMAGSATAMYGFIQASMAFLASFIARFFNPYHEFGLIFIFITLSLISTLAAHYITTHRNALFYKTIP